MFQRFSQRFKMNLSGANRVARQRGNPATSFQLGKESLESRLLLAFDAFGALPDVGADDTGIGTLELAPPPSAANHVGGPDGLFILTSNAQLDPNPSNTIEGFVDVFVQVPSSTSFSTSGYEVSLSLVTEATEVRFTGVEIAGGAHPAVFPGQQPTVLGTGKTLRVTDFLLSGDASLDDGEGLFRALFEVDAGVTGSFPLSFEANFTNLADRQGSPLPVDGLIGGVITVGAPTAVEVSISDTSVAEGDVGNVNAVFNVQLSRASDSPVVVDFRVDDGTATSGEDYLPDQGQIVFAAGQTSKTIEVAVIGDSDPEPDEFFEVALSSVSGAVLESDRATGTILNDDQLSSPWQNPADPLDVNADGTVSPLDALIVINDLNTSGSRPLPAEPVEPNVPPPYLDVNGDGFLSPVDALIVINQLNNQAAAPAISSDMVLAAAVSNERDSADSTAVSNEGDDWPLILKMLAIESELKSRNNRP